MLWCRAQIFVARLCFPFDSPLQGCQEASALTALRKAGLVSSGCRSETPPAAWLPQQECVSRSWWLRRLRSGTSMAGLQGEPSSWLAAGQLLAASSQDGETSSPLSLLKALTPFQRAPPSGPHHLPKPRLQHHPLGASVSTQES